MEQFINTKCKILKLIKLFQLNDLTFNDILILNNHNKYDDGMLISDKIKMVFNIGMLVKIVDITLGLYARKKVYLYYFILYHYILGMTF